MIPASKNTPARTSAEDALRILEEAWAYYTPEPTPRPAEQEPRLFQYYDAA
jgi:predicted RNase H-like HicB family nuclease